MNTSINELTAMDQEILRNLRHLPLDKKLAVLDFVEWLQTEKSHLEPSTSSPVAAEQSSKVLQTGGSAH